MTKTLLDRNLWMIDNIKGISLLLFLAQRIINCLGFLWGAETTSFLSVAHLFKASVWGKVTLFMSFLHFFARFLNEEWTASVAAFWHFIEKHISTYFPFFCPGDFLWLCCWSRTAITGSLSYAWTSFHKECSLPKNTVAGRLHLKQNPVLNLGLC